MTSKPASEGAAAPTAADLAALHVLIDRVNSAAEGPPSEQRVVLDDVVDPERRKTQQGCHPATTTIELLPVWGELRPRESRRFVLPTLVRVRTEGRITSTDVTPLEVLVAAGTAHLGPLCVA